MRFSFTVKRKVIVDLNQLLLCHPIEGTEFDVRPGSKSEAIGRLITLSEWLSKHVESLDQRPRLPQGGQESR